MSKAFFDKQDPSEILNRDGIGFKPFIGPVGIYLRLSPVRFRPPMYQDRQGIEPGIQFKNFGALCGLGG